MSTRRDQYLAEIGIPVWRLRRPAPAAEGGAPPLERFFERWVYESDLPSVVDRSRIVDGVLTIRLEQTNAAIYDLPITATLSFEDGSTRDMIVVMTDRAFELTVREERRIRNVQFNRESGALAEIGD